MSKKDIKYKKIFLPWNLFLEISAKVSLGAGKNRTPCLLHIRGHAKQALYR